jgi:hypothetical protein
MVPGHVHLIEKKDRSPFCVPLIFGRAYTRPQQPRTLKNGVDRGLLFLETGGWPCSFLVHTLVFFFAI